MTDRIVDFLTKSKSYATDAANSNLKFHAVLGNEACDLDSAACAIALAYFLHITKGKDGPIHVPVLNIEKSEYRLKTEVKYLLNKLDAKESLLVFKEDLDLKGLCSSGRLKISLVDFNAFPKELDYLEKCVVQIIDHHGKKRKTTSRVQVIMETIGSCASLVADYIFKTKDFTVINDVAMLLYGAILIDTSCLGNKDRTTEKDIKMVDQLEKQFKDVDRREYYKELLSAKLDNADLTQVELLLKDLKTLKKSQLKKSVSLVISVVYKSVFDFFDNSFVNETAFREVMAMKKADLLIIMFIQLLGDSLLRYLAVYSTNQKLLKEVVDALKLSKSPSLQLEPIVVIMTSPSDSSESNDIPLGIQKYGSSTTEKTMSQQTFASSLSMLTKQASFYAFKQLNVAASRKVVMPILEQQMPRFLKCV